MLAPNSRRSGVFCPDGGPTPPDATNTLRQTKLSSCPHPADARVREQQCKVVNILEVHP